MHAYIFSGDCPIIEAGKWYFFSTPKTTRYLLLVCPQLRVINYTLKRFIKTTYKTLQYKKRMTRPHNIRRRECGLKAI